jgi:hypothetical protein
VSPLVGSWNVERTMRPSRRRTYIVDRCPKERPPNADISAPDAITPAKRTRIDIPQTTATSCGSLARRGSGSYVPPATNAPHAAGSSRSSTGR